MSYEQATPIAKGAHLKLEAIDAELHFAPESRRGVPIRLRLTFSDGESILLTNDSREEMLFSSKELQPPTNIGEYGKVVHQDVICLLSPLLLHMTISRVEVLKLRDLEVGISLVATHGETFHIWTAGDEYWWGNNSSLSEFWKSNGKQVPQPVRTIKKIAN